MFPCSTNTVYSPLPPPIDTARTSGQASAEDLAELFPRDVSFADVVDEDVEEKACVSQFPVP